MVNFNAKLLDLLPWWYSMKHIILGGQVGGLHLHKHICPQLNTNGRHDERLGVVYVLRNETKKIEINKYLILADGCMKVQFKDWLTLKSLSFRVLMKLPLLSFTAIEEADLWEDRTRLKFPWNSPQLLNVDNSQTRHVYVSLCLSIVNLILFPCPLRTATRMEQLDLMCC